LDVDPEEEAYMLSEQWGSFFYHPEEDPQHNRHMNTFWGELITKYCDIAVPSIEYIAGEISTQYIINPILPEIWLLSTGEQSRSMPSDQELQCSLFDLLDQF
jgi:hypothetical protein